MRSSVHIVSHKQVIRVRNIATNAKQFQYIIELSMHISDQRDGAFQNLNIIFLHEYLLDLGTDYLDGMLV